MEEKRAIAIIEAILFAVGESVETKVLADALEIEEVEVAELLEKMKKSYACEDRGIMLVELENAVQLCTKNDTYDYLVKVAATPRRNVMTDALLETLSIVAYKQPVTRLDVEKVRGVNSDHVVSRLVELGLVCEVGRLDAPGRPMLFGTTEQFLRCFGVKSLEDLPEFSNDLVEDFRAQAEAEAQLKLDL